MQHNKFSHRQPSPAATRGDGSRPSYLGQVKEDFAALVADEIRDTETVVEITEHLWQFVAKRLAGSYWNGVAGGASGRVQPKPRVGGDNAGGN